VNVDVNVDVNVNVDVDVGVIHSPHIHHTLAKPLHLFPFRLSYPSISLLFHAFTICLQNTSTETSYEHYAMQSRCSYVVGKRKGQGWTRRPWTSDRRRAGNRRGRSPTIY